MNRNTIIARRRTLTIRQGGFALVPVLFLLLVVGGMMAVVSSHLAHLVQAQRLQTLDVELRQMLDSGAAYAELHHAEADRVEPSVTIDADDLVGPSRAGRLVLRWMPGSTVAEIVCRIEATVEYGAAKVRTAKAGLHLPPSR